jgi:hypothetical protein
MSRPPPGPNIDRDRLAAMTAAQACAFALELTEDSAERYEQLRDCFATHNNEAAAALFGRILALSRATAAAIAGLSLHEPLPQLAPWALPWRCPDILNAGLGTDMLPPQDCSHLFSLADLVRAAQQRERCALAYYHDARQQVLIAATRAMLAEIAARQQHHLSQLDALLTTAMGADDPLPLDDLDPPNRPE